MKTASRDFESLLARRPGDFVNEAMLAGNPTSPPTGKVSLQRFRFSDSFEGGSTNVFDNRVKPTQNIPISRDPVLIVFPGLARKS
jgi:hypothetical protein